MSRAETAEISSPIEWLFLPFKLLWGFVVFMVFAWTTSRHLRPFILSFPAVLGVIAFVAGVWAAEFKGKTVALGRSWSAYKEMSNKESPLYEPDEAVSYIKKATEIQPSEPLFKYELGLAYERNEQKDRAVDVMQWLAPAKADADADNAGNGYSDAHLWMAGYHWLDESKSEDERKALAREHMELAYETNNENVYAVLGLAGMNRDEADRLKNEIEEMEESGGDPSVIAQLKRQESQYADQAVKLFQRGIDLPLSSERQLYASLAIIEMLQNRGQDEKARVIGKQFIIKHEKAAHLFPDALPYWISIVRTCMLIDEYDKANEFILRGYQLATLPHVRQILAELAAQIKVEEAKTYENLDSQSDFLRRLFALAAAVKTNVQVLPAYKELMYFIDDVPADSKQEFWMRDAILGADVINEEDQRDPRLPGIIHIALGFREIVNGRKSNGLEHWEIASQQFDMAPLAINFMIQVYAAEHELSRKKKLHLANCGIQRFPQSPFFYATRGRFNLDDGVYDEAVNDLQFANARIPGNINILENLLAAMNKLNEEQGSDADREFQIARIEDEINQIKSRIAEPEGDQLSKFVQESALDFEQDLTSGSKQDDEPD